MFPIIRVIFLFVVTFFFVVPVQSFSFVVNEGGKTYIVDRLNEKWDVTEAKQRGFDPFYFDYGIGRHAFTTLDDSALSQKHFFFSKNARVIGLEDDSGGKAFSVNKLRGHEVANSWRNDQPVTVAY